MAKRSKVAFASELNTIMKRLANSTTARQRLNARRAARSLFHRVLKEYPTLDESGQPKVRKRAGASCPLCKLPFRTWSNLVVHVHRIHWNIRCRLTPSRAVSHSKNLTWFLIGGPITATSSVLARPMINHFRLLHRAGLLLDHIVAGATKAAFGGST